MENIDIPQEFQSVKNLVGRFLAQDEKCRNSDTYLINKIKAVAPWAHFETIRRMRQTIQNTEGRWLPTEPEVLVKRRIREENIREYFSNRPEIIRSWEFEMRSRGKL